MDYRRARTPGASYFFTVVTYDRRPLLATEAAVALLRAVTATVMRRHPFHIDAMVVLPDHLHAVWTLPDGDDDFSTRWMLVKSGFTRGLGDAAPGVRPGSRKQERAVWQRRFWEHRIRDAADYAAHLDYVHYNPVKHGLVRAPAEWPWSSFNREVRAGRYPADWGSGRAPVFARGVGSE